MKARSTAVKGQYQITTSDRIGTYIGTALRGHPGGDFDISNKHGEVVEVFAGSLVELRAWLKTDPECLATWKRAPLTSAHTSVKPMTSEPVAEPVHRTAFMVSYEEIKVIKDLLHVAANNAGYSSPLENLYARAVNVSNYMHDLVHPEV